MMQGMLILALSLPAMGAGFEQGARFHSHFLDGEIAVTCKDPRTGKSEFAVFRCSAEVLEPAEGSAFIGPALDANRVKIVNEREDGSTAEHTLPFETGRSQVFPLWEGALSQQRLLKYGRNKVAYTLLQGTTPVAAGSFSVQVEQGDERFCSNRRYFRSNQLGDCRSSQRLCQQYFQAENNCK